MLYIPFPLRQCTKCFQWLPWKSFQVDTAYADNLTRQCRKCHSQKTMDTRRVNPESAACAKRATDKYNKSDKSKANGRRYYYNNPDKMKAKAARRRQEHPDYGREYRQRNPEQGRAGVQRRLARKRSLPDRFFAKDWIACLSYWEGKCAYCGNPPGLFAWNKITMDHFVPLSDKDCPGTVPANIVPACGTCNYTKHDNDPLEWLPAQFGPRKGKAVLKRIQDYFEWIRHHEN